jgi:hypothetical protein
VFVLHVRTNDILEFVIVASYYCRMYASQQMQMFKWKGTVLCNQQQKFCNQQEIIERVSLRCR